jgi:oligopeptide transport system substrate-binding protein
MSKIWQFLLFFFCLVAGCAKEIPVPSERRLRISSPHDTILIDPQTVHDVSDYKVIQAIFEGLVVPDPETMEPLPGVAERWTVSGDGKTYEFFIRDEARWTDGKPVTADDFVYSARRALSSKMLCPFVELFFNIRNARPYFERRLRDFTKVGISATTSKTLHIELDSPNSAFLRNLMHPCWSPLNKDVVESIADYNKDIGFYGVIKLDIVSNGPFAIIERIPGRCVLARKNSDYWDADNVLLDLVEFRFYEAQPIAVKEFVEREVDVVELIADREDFVNDCAKEQELVISQSFEACYLAINTANPAFGNPKLRRALAMAIDRERLLRLIGRNELFAAYHFIAPIDHRANRQLFHHDLELARSLFREAGFSDGNPFPPLEIVCNIGEMETIGPVMEQIARDWKHTFGISSSVLYRMADALPGDRQVSKFDVAKVTYGNPNCDILAAVCAMHSKIGKNYCRWKTARCDELIKVASGARTDGEIENVAKLIDEHLADEMPMIPLYFDAHSYLVCQKVRGWVPNAMNLYPLKFVIFRLAPYPRKQRRKVWQRSAHF